MLIVVKTKDDVYRFEPQKEGIYYLGSEKHPLQMRRLLVSVEIAKKQPMNFVYKVGEEEVLIATSTVQSIKMELESEK